MRRTLPLILSCLVWTACGEPTDREQDCNASEFFEQGTQRCQPCPTLTVEDCDLVCGLRIETSEVGCPEVQCAQPGDCVCQAPEALTIEVLACVAP